MFLSYGWIPFQFSNARPLYYSSSSVVLFFFLLLTLADPDQTQFRQPKPWACLRLSTLSQYIEDQKNKHYDFTGEKIKNLYLK